MRTICISSRNGSSPEQIVSAAAHYGLKGTIETVPAEELKARAFPVIIRWKRRYYALIKSIRGDIVTVVDPARGEYKLEMKKLEQLYTGTLISFQKTDAFQTGGKRESLLSLIRGRLNAKDICFRYNNGDRLALDHVSIDVAPGQMIAIVGSTGCGKSTLLKILADLYTAESGDILYDGRHREDIPDVVFHSSVCTVDQEAVMFEDS